MRPRVIVTATLILDAALFGANGWVAIYTGSHTVLSQAVYSITDLVGGVAIFWGYLASKRPPDHLHPFGHGKERFFWSFSASLITFTTAGIIVLLSGLQQVLNPGPVGHISWALLVVGLTLATSVGGILVTLFELRAGRETFADLIDSAQQGIKTIFYQDLVSVVGSIVAFIGIVWIDRTGDLAVDGITAMGVGVVLIATGFVLAAESRELLIGKAVSPKMARDILQTVERNPSVRQVRSLQSMMLGPDDVLLAIRVNFLDGLTTDQVEAAIDNVGQGLRERFPSLRHLIIEPES
jgi:cation diffusion facilitator family transporter